MIDVRDLHFTYAHSNKAAVGGLAFAVEPGEIFGFLGPSGAGKPTTQKILIGLLEGYSGSVRVRGKEVAAWTASWPRAGRQRASPASRRLLQSVSAPAVRAPTSERDPPTIHDRPTTAESRDRESSAIAECRNIGPQAADSSADERYFVPAG